ncbi:ferric reductase-like transmembrane domain-containing protein [Candidatus Micrarchaeota archaeon]|nr:ferric reductase-like transmembrane domain-containing protein [Candidatus Micrarchaeota archaeon]
MQKPSWLFLLLFCGVALIGAYQSLFQIHAMTSFVRFFALSGYFLLCVSLIIGPLVVLWPKEFAQYVEPRRAVGIACFVFAIIHGLLVLGPRWGWDFGFLLAGPGSMSTIPATLVLLALALTSSDYAIKVMGPGLWKNVQRFNYLAFVFSSVHFVLLANGLFVQVNGRTFVNAAEVALLLLGLATVALQAAGFVARRARMAAAKPPQAKPEGPAA